MGISQVVKYKISEWTSRHPCMPVQFKRRSRMRPVSVEERKANPTHNSLKKGVLWEATTVEIMVLDARI